MCVPNPLSKSGLGLEGCTAAVQAAQGPSCLRVVPEQCCGALCLPLRPKGVPAELGNGHSLAFRVRLLCFCTCVWHTLLLHHG